MADEKTRPFQMRVAPEWLDRIDEWRRTQPDIPSRAEAIRRMVDQALDDKSTPGTPPALKGLQR